MDRGDFQFPPAHRTSAAPFSASPAKGPGYAEANRLRLAWEALERCELCEFRCGVNRRAGERGICRLTDKTHVFRAYVSCAEELDLSPALMIYLGGCNFRCGFCTQAPACFHPHQGPELGVSECTVPLHSSRHPVAFLPAQATEPGDGSLLDALQEAAGRVRWINLVGGEPSLHPHALIALRQRLQTPARWLLNTNGYFTLECLSLIDPLFDLHVIDFKFGNDTCTQALSGALGYMETLQRNLLAIHATGPDRLLVRHLLMPGHERCCLEPVAEWVASHLPGVRFHLATGYVPNYRLLRDPAMGRTVPAAAVGRAVAYCRRLGLKLVE